MKTNDLKKQLIIFVAVAFIFPYAMGILMGVAYGKGIDVSVFPSAQMFYPAAAVMMAALITRKDDPLLPKRFFIGYLIFTAIMVICSILSVFNPTGMQWNVISQFVMIIGSVVAWILVLSEKKDKRIAYGLKSGCWKASFLIILLYFALYMLRAVIAYVVSGTTEVIIDIVKNPQTWFYIALLLINYFLAFIAFFGEEYGWRYYLQPILQKKFGLVKGILILGIVWGLWHLPINFFYYSSPVIGIMSLLGQLITCTSLGVFYGWAYLKTDNIWTVVILHFVNNNLIPVISGNYSADVLQNQQVGWGDILFGLIVNTLLFMGVIFCQHYKDQANRLPTMDERADQHNRKIAEEIPNDQIY